ncbi:hypothetical protein [uncultured Roseibium sp.]|uniref:hypothetical protein n=1 Tax=uncultured Roseibium sp. TaxID=1936171 RepID=UPI00321800AD
METYKREGDDCVPVDKAGKTERFILQYGDPHYGQVPATSRFKNEAYESLFSAILSDRLE